MVELDCTCPPLALGVFNILIDHKLGSKEGRFDRKLSLVSRMQGSHSGEVAGESGKMKDGINGSIRKIDNERGVAGKCIDHKFPTRMVVCSCEEGDVTVYGEVGGFDEKLGEISMFATFVISRLQRIVREGDVDYNWRVLCIENQELCSSEVSDDDVIVGLDFTTLNM